MPQTSMLGEPSTPRRGVTTPDLVVVLPDAQPGRRFWSLLDLIEGLDDHAVKGVTAVCWQTGPLVAAVPTERVIDAGAVNDQWGPRALTAAKLVTPARALKSWRLRRRLAPLAACEHVVLGGASTLPLLQWLAPHPNRHVVVWLGDDDLDGLDRILDEADPALVSGDRAAAALAKRGIDQVRWRRVEEPLLASRALVGPTELSGRRLVVVVGTVDAVAGGIASVVTAASAAGAGSTQAVWLHPDSHSRAHRWIDPRFAGLEAQLIDCTIGGSSPSLGEVVAFVLLGPTPPKADGAGGTGDPERARRSMSKMITEAALIGVPVLGIGSTESVAAEVTDLSSLRTHLTTLLADPAAWDVASDEAMDRAQPHRLDRAVRAVVEALDPTPS